MKLNVRYIKHVDVLESNLCSKKNDLGKIQP